MIELSNNPKLLLDNKVSEALIGRLKDVTDDNKDKIKTGILDGITQLNKIENLGTTVKQNLKNMKDRVEMITKPPVPPPTP